MNQSKRKPPAAHRAAKAAPAVMVDPEAATAVQGVRAVEAAPAARAEGPAGPLPASAQTSARKKAGKFSARRRAFSTSNAPAIVSRSRQNAARISPAP